MEKIHVICLEYCLSNIFFSFSFPTRNKDKKIKLKAVLAYVVCKAISPYRVCKILVEDSILSSDLKLVGPICATPPLLRGLDSVGEFFLWGFVLILH